MATVTPPVFCLFPKVQGGQWQGGESYQSWGKSAGSFKGSTGTGSFKHCAVEDKAHILLFPRVLQYIVLGCFQVFWLLLASIFCLSSKISFLHILFPFLCRIFHFQFQLWFSLPCHIPFWTAVQWVSPRKMMMTPFSRFLVLYFVFEHGKL